MHTFRTHFFTLLFLSLSANIYSQINYDSIALDMGYLLEENFDYDESELFEAKFNNEVFKSFITLKDSEDNKALEAFNKNFLEEDFGKLIFKTIQDAVANESSYKFLNYRIDELKNIYILFRLFTSDGGVNYHQYLFEPSGIKEYRITDVYYFLNGQYISQTLETHYYDTVDKYYSDDGVDSDEIMKDFTLARIKRLIENGKIEKARKKFYRDLPEDEQNNNENIFLELQLVDKTDLEAYNTLLDRMVSYAEEGNPSYYLTAIDHFFINEDYQKVIDAVDSLYSFTGDEFLEIYKANSYLEMGMEKEAEQSLIKANEYFPAMEGGYDMLLYFYESRNNTPKLLNVLDTMSKYLQIDMKFLGQNMPDKFPEIAKTELYKNWIDERMEMRKLRVDSLSDILSGNWEFQETQDFDGNTIETSPFGLEVYGNQRPNFSFTSNSTFTSTFGDAVYKEGKWDFDFGYKTLDFYVPIDPKSNEGKQIIASGSYEIINEEYFEIYSYYYYTIDEGILKLFDRSEGINIYTK